MYQQVQSVLVPNHFTAMANEHPLSSLTAVTPVDGRYAQTCVSLREHFSEFALIKRRVIVEVKWLLHLSDEGAIAQLPSFDAPARASLELLLNTFSVDQATRVKEIERTTNHDVKAVEYFLKEHFAIADPSLESCKEFFHFACTSEVPPLSLPLRFICRNEYTRPAANANGSRNPSLHSFH